MCRTMGIKECWTIKLATGSREVSWVALIHLSPPAFYPMATQCVAALSVIHNNLGKQDAAYTDLNSVCYNSLQRAWTDARLCGARTTILDV